ncbi:hypothetical protein P170DRAFT_506908 [Aspergillus steynii IBT 23096]|uniref:Rhodopsin domain-containing protein n=1 Tax=Aspergillus steynii IBT 23096 TaxID=1392250 RepID=A0A2I2GGJ5_9EURO|nr:uncharacterized protein P170DRAFT_506908 [Aspergillus steynii IBT 23096]PLB52003.1 hypothetical protein P170DRAFT_506908 [Aspergillus steynii IBT 23096]
MIFFGILATFALVIRVYTRAFILRRMKIADYSLILGWLNFVAYLVTGWLAAESAPMIDQWNLRLRNFLDLLFRFYVGSACYGGAMLFIKVAILLNILEIFWLEQTLTRACHILMWANGIFYINFIFLQIFACRPINKSWDVFITDGAFFNTRLVTLVAGAINTVSDLIILILPQRRIWALQSPLRKKLAVSGLFSLGLFACISSIVRLYYSVIISYSPNQSYYGYISGIWTVPEMAFGIMVAGFPLLPKFISHLRENSQIARLKTSIRSSRLTPSGTGRRSIIIPSNPSSARAHLKRPRDPDEDLLITSPSHAIIERSSDGMC